MYDKTMNEPIQLVPTKPDAELAEELKQELIKALEPTLVVATKALSLGFHVNFNLGSNAFKQVVIQNLQLMKVF